ncbi:terpene cyclase/mutase family protein [Candidatus Poribacteria bacterium]|nr:terpene cyclase/mutase family protein [Candidatus Poribacteria bacterium]
MKMKNMIGLMLVLIMGSITVHISAHPNHVTDATKYDELNKRVIASIDKGLGWLKTQQREDGLFEGSPGEGHPGITALAITAFLRHPQKKYSDEKHPFIQKAIQRLIEMQHENGAIYDVSKQPALPNYTTSISVMALSSTDNPKKYEDVIKKAQGFIKSLQIQDEESVYYGGIGYGSRESVHDLSNLNLAIQALKESGSDDDEVWNKAIKFLERTQNRSESNDQKWAGNDGGFIYSPDGESKAGKDEAGSPRSYASMTYAGLLSFIYAKIDKNDERVKSAVQWIGKHFTVEENYGMGAQGLYYNYHTMAKALRLYGKAIIIDAKGVSHDWYQELAEKLLEVQKPEGFWINENSRWMEALPVLATSYAILSLDTAYPKQK